MEYSAGMVSASFWYLETKTTAEYLLDGLSRKELTELSLNENIYQVDSERRAKRMVGVLFRRLKGFSNELLEYLVTKDSNSGKLLVLISILKEDRLFFEFMYEVFREHILLGNYTLKNSDFDIFFRNKANQSEKVESWNESTVRRLKTNYRLFLSEAGLLNIEDGENKILIPFLDYRLRKLLEENNFGPYIKAITGES